MNFDKIVKMWLIWLFHNETQTYQYHIDVVFNLLSFFYVHFKLKSHAIKYDLYDDWIAAKTFDFCFGFLCVCRVHCLSNDWKTSFFVLRFVLLSFLVKSNQLINGWNPNGVQL